MDKPEPSDPLPGVWLWLVSSGEHQASKAPLAGASPRRRSAAEGAVTCCSVWLPMRVADPWSGAAYTSATVPRLRPAETQAGDPCQAVTAPVRLACLPPALGARCFWTSAGVVLHLGTAHSCRGLALHSDGTTWWIPEKQLCALRGFLLAVSKRSQTVTDPYGDWTVPLGHLCFHPRWQRNWLPLLCLLPGFPCRDKEPKMWSLGVGDAVSQLSSCVGTAMSSQGVFLRKAVWKSGLENQAAGS